MLIRRALAAAIITAAATALVFAGASDAGTSSKAKKTVKLTAKLKGSNEIPPADPDGSGKAEVKLKAKKGKVCFDISFQGIGDAIMGHIHKGNADENGDIKVPFFEEPMGVSSPVDGCVKAKKSLIKKIAKKPSGWYVNVHTPDFPNGAIRGQLKEKGSGGGGSSGGGGTGGGGTGGGGGGYPRSSDGSCAIHH